MLPFIAVGVALTASAFSGVLGAGATGRWIAPALPTLGAASMILVFLRVMAWRSGAIQLTDRPLPRGEAGELARHDTPYRALVESAADVIMLTDTDGACQYVSPSVTEMLGLLADDLHGPGFLARLHPDDRAAMQEFCRATILAAGVTRAEFRVQEAGGSWRLLEATARPLPPRQPANVVLVLRDMTDRQAHEQYLRQLAFHDPLTELPNRSLFMDRLRQASTRSARNQSAIAVMLLDLDRFKLVNDSLGHRAGDQLLIETGRRLRAELRAGDTVARLGGDEFVILCEDVTPVRDAGFVAARIVETLARPFTIQGRELYVTCSIGISLTTPGRAAPGDPIREADIALYRAKAAGGSRFVTFESHMSMEVEGEGEGEGRMDLEGDLRHAISRGELHLHYQPEIDMTTGAIVGMEALVRWAHPTRGLLAPREFLPLAEETGVIIEIGRWVLEQACHQAAAWQAFQPNGAPLVISVNLSARQFRQPDLVAQIAGALTRSGLDAAGLRLEIAESVAMQDVETAVLTLQSLNRLGVRLAIDNFGAGPSSLGHARRFAVHTLKIDRSFVRDMGHDRAAVVVVEAVTALAHALGMDVTADGIETAEQHRNARDAHCDHGQGFYLGRPASVAHLSHMLEAGRLPATDD